MMKRIGEGGGKNTGSPSRPNNGSERPASPSRAPAVPGQSPSASRVPTAQGQSPSSSRLPTAPQKSASPGRPPAAQKKLTFTDAAPSKSTSASGSGRLSPQSAEIRSHLQSIYDEFARDASPGQEKKRSQIVDAVLAKQPDIFTSFESQHFAVLLSIAPERVSDMVAQYFSATKKMELFQATITEPVVNPLPLMVKRQEFDALINQWVEREFFEQHLYRYRELLQWMFLKDRFRPEHWAVLVNEICQGRFRELLSDQTGFGPTLWDKLCVFLAKNTETRDQCLYDDQFLCDYLLHLSLENRKALFKEVVDPALMQRILLRCARSRQHMHVIYSVLNTCFTEIHNEHFYGALIQYPHFIEHALAVAPSGSIDLFVRKHAGRPWCSPDIFSAQIPQEYAGELRSEADEVRIAAFLDGILDDQCTSEELPEELLVDYYTLGLPPTRAQMLANPVLMNRLLVLRDAKSIRIQLHAEIFLLLHWMLSELMEDQPVDFTHLFRSDAMACYFVGAVEWLFSQSHENTNASFLESLFEHFGPYFFSGITIGQLGHLAKIRGNNEIIFDEFARQCPEIVNCYRALRAARDENIKKRWKQTVGKEAEFVEEFKYKGPEDDERWMRLLWCNWDDSLKAEVVVNELMRQAAGLRFADFLKSIAQTPRINQLFSQNIYLAKKVVTTPGLFGRCGFTLEIFVHWDFRLLWLVISNPELHRFYGFTSEDFYRLVIGPNRDNVFKKDEGYLAALLSYNRLSGDAKDFLIHTFLTAPSCVYALTDQYEMPMAVLDSAEDSTPWAAKGRSCDPYDYKEEFSRAVDEKGLASRQATLIKTPNHAGWQAFLTEVSNKDCVFILGLLKDPAVLAKLKSENGKIENWQKYFNEATSATLKNIRTILNTNPLLRSVSIMRNPTWLEIAIRCSRHAEFVGLDSNITCYLQLPGFLPTTADLSPSYLYFETPSVAVKLVVVDRPIKMVEYLISLCHYSFTNLDKDLDGDQDKIMIIKARAAILVEVGIEAYFRELTIDRPGKAEYFVQRFVCLFCSATELLEPEALLELLNRNKALRNQLCRWLLAYNLSAVPVAQVPALVRVQMLMLRSFASDQKLSQKPSREDIANKQHSLGLINEILWQFRCISLGAIDRLNEDALTINQSAYQLDLPLLEQLPIGKYLANLLRYDALASLLSENDVITLVRRDEGGDIARACLLHASLHKQCSDEFISECVRKVGYTEESQEMLEKLQEEWGLVIDGSPRLQDWLRSMEQSLGHRITHK